MTRLFFCLLLICCLCCISCEKKLESNGRIVGFDGSKCGCCWGWQLETGGETFIIGTWPKETFPFLPGDTTLRFPISVFVEIEKDGECFQSRRKVIATQLQRL